MEWVNSSTCKCRVSHPHRPKCFLALAACIASAAVDSPTSMATPSQFDWNVQAECKLDDFSSSLSSQRESDSVRVFVTQKTALLKEAVQFMHETF